MKFNLLNLITLIALMFISVNSFGQNSNLRGGLHSFSKHPTPSKKRITKGTPTNGEDHEYPSCKINNTPLEAYIYVAQDCQGTHYDNIIVKLKVFEGSNIIQEDETTIIFDGCAEGGNVYDPTLSVQQSRVDFGDIIANNTTYKFVYEVYSSNATESILATAEYSVTFSSTCNATTNDNQIVLIESNNAYPNPTSGFSTLEYTLTQNANVTIMLSDSQGNYQTLLPSSSQNSGLNTLFLNLRLKPNGYYHYTIIASTLSGDSDYISGTIIKQ